MKSILCCLLLSVCLHSHAQDCDRTMRKIHEHYSGKLKHYELKSYLKSVAREAGLDTNDLSSYYTVMHCSEATVIPSFENPPSYCWMKSIMERIEHVLPSLHIQPVPDLCYGAPFLKTSVAHCDTADGHPVLLMHSTIPIFLTDFIKLGVAKADVQKDDYVEIGLPQEKPIKLPIVDEVLLKRLETLVEIFVDENFNVQETLTLHHHLGSFVQDLTYKATQFVLCHEYAHLLTGDTRKPVNNIQELWRRELNADRLGYQIYMAIESEHPDPEKLDIIWAMVPSCYFSAVELIEDRKYFLINERHIPKEANNYLSMKSLVDYDNDSIIVSDQLNQKFPGAMFYPPAYLRNEFMMMQFLNRFNMDSMSQTDMQQVRFSMSVGDNLRALSKKYDETVSKASTTEESKH